MKITFTADENLIKRARLVARSQNTTLNAAFREWLVQFTGQRSRREFRLLMERLRGVKAGHHFGRDEMNER